MMQINLKAHKLPTSTHLTSCSMLCDISNLDACSRENWRIFINQLQL
jgi:hypothetical protein